ncbi:hypothetical protein Scep_010728 [Stephania cephalantha]|uniref:protein-serine/threonine phosphatase n=1 Tax=Stephania cephalantha TaxID=152367 RepID=A0AAP0JY22_9MAGN
MCAHIHIPMHNTRVEDAWKALENEDYENVFALDPEEVDNEISASSVRTVTHGFSMVKGKLNHAMEDYIVAETKQLDHETELGLYAIFDGHSGERVAEYLQSHLFDSILNELDFWTDTKNAVKRAYRKTDDDILERVASSRGGSTAVTVILINKETLVGNVGDSRAIISKAGVAQQITLDHEPRSEQDVIESKGGHVSKMPEVITKKVFDVLGKVPRVDGQLAMARAFGDGKLKEHITSEPDVSIKMIDEGTDFLILASDGLWKVMSNQEAVDTIKHIEDAQEAAEELVGEALHRQSVDDISCIVVRFE